ncbi:Unknown protein [Striga hermonthica]|uniref:Nuclease associated modular domain-containing protein n=1 Tax=Striga hermonthica TaxID=68872 RepID=A0A9N7RAI6_STRHE|nr:Unknown protein [Striga hermonthica]
MGKNYAVARNKAWGRLTIEAVATLEITSVPRDNGGVKVYQNALRMDLDSVRSISSDSKAESSNDGSTEMDEREKMRREKISKANKGNVPWNKGRKHSPETLQKIKERTWLAMQDPKVKMKLMNLGHAQSEETRKKIRVGVRLGWERRREKLMVQEACHHEWQNLIALAAKRGLSVEEELEWDSYKILNEELEKEWLEQMNNPKSKGNRRAPKSAEQKRKISEAISAKWADPEYRNQVRNSMIKYYSTREGVERRPRRNPSGDGLPRKRSPKNDAVSVRMSPFERIRSKRSKTPSYKDPLASSKLEMLKHIRAQRASSVDKRSVAITRARLLIAEAEKAIEVLEISAKMNPLAEASLLESRMLIAEANQIIESIDGPKMIPFENGESLSKYSTAPEPIIFEYVKVNGVESKFENMNSNDFLFPNLVNGKASSSFDEKLQHMTGSNGHFSLQSKDLGGVQADSSGSSIEGLECSSENIEGPEKQIIVTKKWVRGRLISVEAES